MDTPTIPAADLAVIIVSYGSAQLIPACLGTVYAAAESDGLALDVVIADNDLRTPVPAVTTACDPTGGHYGWEADSYCPRAGGQVWSDNVWDDSGAPVRCVQDH